MRINKLTAAGAVLAVVAAGGAVTATAWAAPATGASQAQLRIAGKVKLGHLPAGIPSGEITQAAGGAVYYVRNAKVYKVHGTHAPVLVLDASAPVLAVAASRSDLYIETGKTVIEVDLATGVSVRHWHVSSPQAVTQAGLYLVGRTLWSWTDWETDSSGLEYATVSRISITSAAVHQVTSLANPDVFVAGPSGLYFTGIKSVRSGRGVVERAKPGGGLLQRTAPYTSALALWRGDLVGIVAETHRRAERWSASTLHVIGSASVGGAPITIDQGSAGLVALRFRCATLAADCHPLGVLAPATGHVSHQIGVAGAVELVPGPRSAVISVNSTGTAYLNWLAS
jgi:hypothetical protein